MDDVKTLSGHKLSSFLRQSPHSVHRARQSPLHFALPALTFAIAGVYMWSMLRRGWIPHDEGALAQSAERVLLGQLPHRDFDELYTGGLSFLNAIAFAALGLNLFSMRLVLFAFFLAWVPCYYYCATRYVKPLSASALTLAAVAWGLPNYAAALPSWYNMFFATAAMALLLRFTERRSTYLLVLAGVVAGTSILFKSVGVYVVAAILFFLLYSDQNSPPALPGSKSTSQRARLVVCAGCLAFLLLLYRLVQPRLGVVEVLHFLLPGTLITLIPVLREIRGIDRSYRQRSRDLIKLILPFLVGVAIPVFAFLVPYVVTGSLARLWDGLAVGPFRRMVYAADSPPPLIFMLPALLLIGLLVGAKGLRNGAGVFWLTGLLLATILVGSSAMVMYQVGWQGYYAAPPIVVVMGSLALMSWSSDRTLTRTQREQVFLALSVTALFALIQFPFSSPVYFCYLAPIFFLAVAALQELSCRFAPQTIGPLLVFTITFPIVRVTPGFVYNMGIRASVDEQTEPLQGDRTGGLRVSKTDAQAYAALLNVLRRRAPEAVNNILAMPDAPEVYFLSGKQNPTRTLFDFFEPGYPERSEARAVMQTAPPAVLVLNNAPAFSGMPSATELSFLVGQFPESLPIGRFTVRWR